MLFDDDIEFSEDELLPENPYLDSALKGIGLVKDLFVRKSDIRNSRKFDRIITKELFPVLGKIGLPDSLEIYSSLSRIRSRVTEQEKIRLLRGKKVVGVGGKFSAGKSSFINALTGTKLPDGQNPTTSVATYIVHADENRNIAVTSSDNVIELDDDAVEALTHEFSDKYNGIGFSRIINNLVIYSADFPYENIAIIDTPGYSKHDNSNVDNNSDAEIARRQLRSADYLIWLVDSVQGVITQRDIEFISSLNIQTEILVVMTKADLVSEEDIGKKIEQSRISMQATGRPVFDIIAYDSYSGETVAGGDSLERFMDMVNASATGEDDTVSELRDMSSRILHEINTQIRCDQEAADNLQMIISATMNAGHISSLVREYARLNSHIMMLSDSSSAVMTGFEKLISLLSQMEEVQAVE